MKRREFITLLGGATAWPLAARAQQPTRSQRLAVLTGFRENDPESQRRIGAFISELHSLGWINGLNVNIDFRFAGAAPDQMGRYARELVDLGPNVILVQSFPGLAAVVDATITIPTIFVQLAVDDPIVAGLVRTHSRPGGNMTGFTNFEFSMAGKWVELLKEVAPAVSRACLIVHSEGAVGHSGYVDAAEAAGRKLGISIFPKRLHDSAGVEQAIVQFATEPDGGLVLFPSNLTAVNRALIFKLAQEYKLPSVSAFRYMAASGGLLSYGIDLADVFRRAAIYVDKILRGTKPESLPIQQPDKFELVINVKTAKALGLTVPPTLINIADEVIE